MKRHWILVAALVCAAADLGPGVDVQFQGNLRDDKNLSGLALVGEYLVVATDEIGEVQVLKKHGADRFDLTGSIALDDDVDIELDLEGVAYDGDYVYAIGSHSITRKGVEEKLSRDENRKRLRKFNDDEDGARQQLFRFAITGNGEMDDDYKVISLTEILSDDKYFERSLWIPSKENGLDFEGIAARDGELTVGCRGPVLRGGYVPVISFDFDDASDYEVRFVQLGGLGIRDLLAVEDGFLILAGPIDNGPGEFELYHWDGHDQIPDNENVPLPDLLGTVPVAEGAKAEGITLLAEDDQNYQVLIICDGPAGGAPRKFTIPK